MHAVQKVGIFAGANTEGRVCIQQVSVEPRLGEGHCSRLAAEKTAAHTGTDPQSFCSGRGDRKQTKKPTV